MTVAFAGTRLIGVEVTGTKTISTWIRPTELFVEWCWGKPLNLKTNLMVPTRKKLHWVVLNRLVRFYQIMLPGQGPKSHQDISWSTTPSFTTDFVSMRSSKLSKNKLTSYRYRWWQYCFEKQSGSCSRAACNQSRLSSNWSTSNPKPNQKFSTWNASVSSST